MITKIFDILKKLLLIIASVILLTECGKRTEEGKFIITIGGQDEGSADYVSGESWRYTARARMLLIDPENPEKAEMISSDFISARSPEVSYDATHLLFTGQKSEDASWQIWEMDLRDREVRQITDSEANSIDPAYLPDGRIVFSRYHKDDSLKSGYSLYTCNRDGSNIKRITFNPHNYFASSVLRDGRIMAITRQVYPVQSSPYVVVLRPDGTKAELFYRGHNNEELLSRGWETDDGLILFVESGDNGMGPGDIISLNYNRPLKTRRNLTASIADGLNSVFPLVNGNYLVSGTAGTNSSVLYEFDPEGSETVEEVYKSNDGEIIEAVEIAVHERPRKLPSEVDSGVKTGLILCQNINVTASDSPETGFSTPLANRIEVIGVDSTLGVVKVEEDGSVYLKVAADMPFRIRTIDSKGETVYGPGGWYWLRPNERRGCIGCHEDPELVPANRYAIAVSKEPNLIPVHLSGIKEKEVELE